MHEHQHHTREHRPHEHHHIHHHHHILYLRLIPHVRRVWHGMGHHTHMDASHLDRMAEQVWRESGLSHDMPAGHTRESMHDFILILLLALADGMMDDGNMPMAETFSPMHDPAAEAFNPLWLAPWWFGFPYGPSPFFFPGRHRHFGRPGGRPGGGRPGGGHRPR